MNFIWNIRQLRVKNIEGQTNVVWSVEWRCTETISGQFTEGDELIEYLPTSNFITYENLTQNQVFSWVESKIDKQEIEVNLKNRIEMLALEQTKLPITNTLPWSN